MRGSGTYEFLAVGDRRWIKPDSGSLPSLGGGAGGRALPPGVAGDYLAVPSGDQKLWAPFAQLCDLDRLLAQYDSLSSGLGVLTRTGTDRIDGVQAVKYHSAAAVDSDIYVAAEGTPYPVKIETLTGDGAGTVWFGGFDRPVEVSAPPAELVMDPSKLPSTDSA
ncbi:hypothetical protein AB0D08_00055 [Kitasatospora sp. NPDC048540]|uniref:hypothetical protein n=1 Tax=Kitasatospora sp. NPDC048540 TaxID=3155634 RepID=UPI0033F30D76